MNEDNCKIKAGTWGLYIHHECAAHKHETYPEYIKGTYASRKQS